MVILRRPTGVKDTPRHPALGPVQFLVAAAGLLNWVHRVVLDNLFQIELLVQDHVFRRRDELVLRLLELLIRNLRDLSLDEVGPVHLPSSGLRYFSELGKDLRHAVDAGPGLRLSSTLFRHW